MPSSFARLLCLACTIAFAGLPAQAQPHEHPHDHGQPGERPTPYPDRIVLTWAEDPASSLSVTWRTDSTVAAGQAQIALARAEPSFYTQARTVEATTTPLPAEQVPEHNVGAHYHSVTFTGLTADTLYAYRVGDGTRWSEWIHARTASTEPEPFSFVYFGDAQNNVRSHWSRVIRAAYAKAPDAAFIIHAGDLIDNAHRNLEWGHWNEAGGFIQRMVPNVPVPGNHEYDAFERWMERDTLAIAATVSGDRMEGTLTEADGDDEPLVATRDAAAPGDGALAGAWTYDVDDGDYTGTLHLEEASSAFSGRLVTDDGATLPLQNVAVDGNALSAEFMMEVEKEGPEHLSIHWRPQFALPENGPEGMEETVYFLDYQGLRIIGLNSNLRDPEPLRRQTQWLEATLADAADDPAVRWTVITLHHPMFSSSQGRDNEELRAAWTPLFDRYQVDLVLQGHDHTYARGRTENLPQGVSARSPVGGTVYVNSVSGAKMYELKEERWQSYEGVALGRAAENTQLFQVVHVAQDTLTYRAYTATDQPYDAFHLVRQPGDAPNEMIELPAARTEERTHENTLDYARPPEQ